MKIDKATLDEEILSKYNFSDSDKYIITAIFEKFNYDINENNKQEFINECMKLSNLRLLVNITNNLRFDNLFKMMDSM